MSTKPMSPEATRLIEILVATENWPQQRTIVEQVKIVDHALQRARDWQDTAEAEVQSMRSMQQRIQEDRETLETRHQNAMGQLREEMARERKAAASHLRNVDHRLSALRHRYRSGILARDMIKRIELERRRLAKENQNLRSQLDMTSAKHVELIELRDDMESIHGRLGDLLGLNYHPGDDYDEGCDNE